MKDILSTLPAQSGFNYLFSPDKSFFGMWHVSEAANRGEFIGLINTEDEVVEMDAAHEGCKEAILEEFAKFKERPEYFITQPLVDVNDLDQESLISEYEWRLAGVVMSRASQSGKDPDLMINMIQSLLDWLRSTDFYIAPASTEYHDSEPSGLLKHSLRVFNHAIRLRNDEVFTSVSFDSAALVSLTHDWCKIGLYEMYMRNVKNEETNQWEKVPSYRHNQKGVPLGHGVTSMFLVSKFFRLSTEEACALRWHMGEYNVAHNEMNELHLANESFPLVFLIQFADRLSITKYAN